MYWKVSTDSQGVYHQVEIDGLDPITGRQSLPEQETSIMETTLGRSNRWQNGWSGDRSNSVKMGLAARGLLQE